MLNLRDICWPLGKRTYIMGILNITPDSFSDGGQYNSAEAAVGAAIEMINQGADIIDVGGQSTRPGSTEIGPEEEWARIADVLGGLKENGILFSVDTYYPEVARKALAAGALMINDVSGRTTREMAEAVKEYSAAWVLMSRAGTPEAVKDSLNALAAEAMTLGVPKENICLDPGIGFGKGNEECIEIIKRTADIKPQGFAYLMAASRKRCVGYFSGIEKADERDEATAQLHSIAIAGGADIIRVHNVALAAEFAAQDDIRFRR